MNISSVTDVQAISEVVSLNDPLTMERIQHPARSVRCKHIQSFDFAVYLAFNEKFGKFKCPVCNNDLRFTDMAYDQFFASILKDDRVAGNISVSRVKVNPNGSWELADEVQPRKRTNSADLHAESRKRGRTDSVQSLNNGIVFFVKLYKESVVDLTEVTSLKSRSSNQTPEGSATLDAAVSGASNSSSVGEVSFSTPTLTC